MEALIGSWIRCASSQAILHNAASSCSSAGKGRGSCVPLAACYSGGSSKAVAMQRGRAPWCHRRARAPGWRHRARAPGWRHGGQMRWKGVGQSERALGGSDACPLSLVLSRVKPGPAVMGHGPWPRWIVLRWNGVPRFIGTRHRLAPHHPLRVHFGGEPPRVFQNLLT
jgi:hypothetical protein